METQRPAWPAWQLDELAAVMESIRCAVAAIGQQLPDPAQALHDYDQCALALRSLVQGQPKSEWYLGELDRQIDNTRRFLAAPRQT
jgi:hypothetical protein